MRLRDKLIRFMYGRYGIDQFGKFLIYTSMFLIIINTFFRSAFIYLIAFAGIILGYYRVFSKNIYKRSYENDKYLKITEKIKALFCSLFKKNNNKNYYSSRCNSFKGNNTYDMYKVFKCPSCKQKLRVPRGKGKIQISCKRCGHNFIKKT